MTEQTQFSFDPTESAGKRALVTGGTEGMGEAIVRRLSAAGAMVATTARSPLPEGQSVKLFVQADISTPEDVGKVARGVLELPSQHNSGKDRPRERGSSGRRRGSVADDVVIS